MTPIDDHDLIDQLQSGIAERQSGVSAPDGIGDQARRAARRRTATRAVGAGVPVLAAAGAATVLAIGSGSASPVAGSEHAGGPALSAPTGPVRAQDTAYVVKRVKARVADSQGGTVVHEYQYASGSDSNGSLVNLGAKMADEYVYTAPNGTYYRYDEWRNGDGSTFLTGSNVQVPDANGDGKGTDTRILVNPLDQTYSEDQFSGIGNPNAGRPTPNLYSSPSDVQQALQSDQVTQKGTGAVNGTPAIALSIALPSSDGENLTLYVDAQTYQPLRMVATLDDHPDLSVSDWTPATSENIAQAENNSIPGGYTKVDFAQVTH